MYLYTPIENRWYYLNTHSCLEDGWAFSIQDDVHLSLLKCMNKKLHVLYGDETWHCYTLLKYHELSSLRDVFYDSLVLLFLFSNLFIEFHLKIGVWFKHIYFITRIHSTYTQ